MSPKYTVEAADGFYIARNGEGVLDLADSQDYEFAKFVCSALNQAAQQSVYLTAFGRNEAMMKYSDLATRYLKDANVSASHSKREKWLIAEFADWLDKHVDQQGVQEDVAEPVCKICSSPAVCKDGYCQVCR